MIAQPGATWRTLTHVLATSVFAVQVAHATVIGTDDRVRVAHTTDFPSSAVVQLVFDSGFGSRSMCSGALIGPNIALTAANCIHSGTVAGRAYGDFRVIPGRDGTVAPFGECAAIKTFTLTGWTAAETPQDARKHDLGALILDCDIGESTGWFGLDAAEALAPGEEAVITGYAADLVPLGVQWESVGELTVIWNEKVFYQIDTYGGTGGAPVARTSDPGTIIAIHVNGLHGDPPWSENNAGTRINSEILTTIREWMAEAETLRGEDAVQARQQERDRAEAAWAEIEDGSSLVAFEDFLLRHPSSSFADLARKRISELEDAAFLRQKIGESNMEPISAFGAGTVLREMAAPVGLLRVGFAGIERELTCTAFLVGPDHALTSLSCLKGPGDRSPETVTLTLNKTDARSSDDEVTFAVDVAPAAFDEVLGFAVLRVDGAPGDTWGSLPLADADPLPGEALTVVHYPGGIEQYVTRGRCRSALINSESALFTHTCDTLIGSAGAPIFAEGDKGAVVGIHVSGFDPLDDGDTPNDAVSMRAILAKSQLLGGIAVAKAPASRLPETPNGDEDDRIWAIIGGTSDPELFRAYLRDFPDGKYRTEAEQRLRELEILSARLDPTPSDLGETVSTRPVDVRNATVFIECEAGDDRRRGTGVIISGDGHVLTALHIAPDPDYACWAALGSSAVRPDHRMAWRKSFRDADTVMLQLVEPFKEAGAVVYVALADDHLLAEAASYGFPKVDGRISGRVGRISDTFESGIGFIEIDDLNMDGMAGAPVVLGVKNGPMIGLVVGKDFDANGRPTYLGVISANVLSNEFQLERR